jgi:protein ImuA
VSNPSSPDTLTGVAETFQNVVQDALPRPLTEIVPVAPGDGAAALGFALGWIGLTQAENLILIAGPDSVSAETGGPYAPGTAQFGLPTARLIHVRTRTLKEALWASEQTLELTGARVLCLVPHDARLTLTATRRLHLAAEKSGARCVLVRFDPLSPSAAWTRWNVAAAPSRSVGLEMGKPRFAVTLARRRSGRSGQRWLLEWNAHEHAFSETDRAIPNVKIAMAGVVAAASADRQTEALRRSAG